MRSVYLAFILFSTIASFTARASAEDLRPYCVLVDDEDLVKPCEDAISSKPLFVASVYNACTRLRLESDRIRCLDKVRGFDFNLRIIAMCDQLSNGDETIECLELARGKNSLSFQPLAGLAQPTLLKRGDICELLDDRDSIEICRNALAEENRVPPIALQVCGRLNFESDRAHCLTAIINHQYNSLALEACDQMDSWHEISMGRKTIRCINKIADRCFTTKAVEVAKMQTSPDAIIDMLDTLGDSGYSDDTLAACAFGVSNKKLFLSCLKTGKQTPCRLR